MVERSSFDVLVVGAGPAGIAAASVAAECGRRVAVVDDNPALGGQIWRGAGSGGAARWFQRLERAGAALISETQVIAQAERGVLLAESADKVRELAYDKLILATGARERFIPFPGWTLPNVMGAGGLQALVKGGLPIAGKRVIVAGTGPLLLAVAAYLRKRGAIVPLIAEQASKSSLIAFGLYLGASPGKLAQAIGLKGRLLSTRYVTGCWPVCAEGEEQLASVALRNGRHTWRESCDYLACGFGLVPNLELAQLLGCEIKNAYVAVDEWQHTSIQDIYCAGEPTGIGGLDLALSSGQIAGYSAAGQPHQARRHFRRRARALQFMRATDRTFALGEELKVLPVVDTIVCRCEDVPFGRIKQHHSWRSAKLQTRCGMGPCQGRICGAALDFLLGWKAESVRSPIFSTRLDHLTG